MPFLRTFPRVLERHTARECKPASPQNKGTAGTQRHAKHTIAIILINLNQISAVIEATSGNVNTVGQASAQLHNTASELRELIKHLEKALV